MPEVAIQISDEEATWLRKWMTAGEESYASCGNQLLRRLTAALPQPLPWKNVDGVEICAVGDSFAVNVAGTYHFWNDTCTEVGSGGKADAERFLRSADRGTH